MNNSYDFTDKQNPEVEKKEEVIKKLEAQLHELHQRSEDERNKHTIISASVPSTLDILKMQAENAGKLFERQNLTMVNYNLPSYNRNFSRLQAGVKIITAFDEYVLEKQVGQGGCGRVFLATNSDNDELAIKFLDRNIGKTKLKRFKNEIHFCEHNSQANIIQVIDHGYFALENNEYVFCVMPFYEQSLRDKINLGIMPETAIKIFVGLLDGLQYAHGKGIIHRDIKPENILFAKDSDIPVICDFGIAHFMAEDMVTYVETKPTERLANFLYSAPEQRIKGEEIGPQTDIFAIGLILNEMFTRSVPQAVGYKRIIDCVPDYGFLDNLVDQLYKNDLKERLYPETKIKSELKQLYEETFTGKKFTFFP